MPLPRILPVANQQEQPSLQPVAITVAPTQPVLRPAKSEQPAPAAAPAAPQQTRSTEESNATQPESFQELNGRITKFEKAAQLAIEQKASDAIARLKGLLANQAKDFSQYQDLQQRLQAVINQINLYELQEINAARAAQYTAQVLREFDAAEARGDIEWINQHRQRLISGNPSLAPKNR